MGELLRVLGVPGTVIALLGLMGWTALGAIKLWRELHGDRSSRRQPKDEITAEALAENLQHDIDRQLTDAFDQLRRDLTTTIERQHQLSRDDFRDVVLKTLLEQEVERLRGRRKR